ncbi:MAG: RNA polymerase sigma factor [Planctomycetota bacterium]|jgi:RNA polymerase sigma-70 factor (ECF subfamily)
MRPTRHADNNGHDGPSIDWAEELAAHRGWLRSVIAARLGEGQAVDDVFQEVALAAVEQRSPIADPARVAAWLYRLAVVHATRYRRKVARRRRHERRAAGIRRSADQAEEIPLEWLLRKERRDLVQAALGRLAGRDAEILILKYFERWSYRTLAERLDISEKAVDARLHRARGRLRAELKNLLDEEPSCSQKENPAK